MDKEIAKQLLELAFSIDEPCNQMSLLSDKIEDEEERHAVRKVIGTIGELLYCDLMRPIFKQYPELDEEKYYGDK